MNNNNKLMLDRPMWEQLSFSPATGAAGTCIADDGERYIYMWLQTSSSAAQFWRYDTFGDTYQQLANPSTVTGNASSILFTKVVGTQYSGNVFGSVYLFSANGTTCYFYRYDIATNTWTANLGTTNIPAAFSTDSSLCYPSVPRNNYETSYHSGVTRTVQTTALAAAGSTTVSVQALPEALTSGTILRFGYYNIAITATAAKGSTSISVSGSIEAMKSGTIFKTNDGKELCLSGDSLAGATTLSVFPLLQSIQVGSIVKIEKFAVLTASAAVSATSLTVSPLRVGIANADIAGYQGNMYLIGNALSAMYRYNIGANTWNTTSANTGNPAIPAVTGAVGQGNALKWLPSYNQDKLWCLRGASTSTVYLYDLVSNTWSTQTYYPSTEAFTTGTFTAVRDVDGKGASLLIQKDGTMRVYEGVPYRNTLECKMNQWLYPTSSISVGDRGCVMTSPDGVDFYYMLLHGSTAFVRCALIDS